MSDPERIPGLDIPHDAEPPTEVIEGPMRLTAWVLAWVLMGVLVTILFLCLINEWSCQGLSCEVFQ